MRSSHQTAQLAVPISGLVQTQQISWTPAVVEGVTPTLTVNEASFTRIPGTRTIIATGVVTTTSAGTVNTEATVSLPVASDAKYTTSSVIGVARYRTATPARWRGLAVWASASTFKIDLTSDPGDIFLGNTASAVTQVATGATISFEIIYEAAS